MTVFRFLTAAAGIAFVFVRLAGIAFLHESSNDMSKGWCQTNKVLPTALHQL